MFYDRVTKELLMYNSIYKLHVFIRINVAFTFTLIQYVLIHYKYILHLFHMFQIF